MVVAVQEPGLTGAGLRGPVRLPAMQFVGAVLDPAGDVRACARRRSPAAGPRGRGRRSRGRGRRARSYGSARRSGAWLWTTLRYQLSSSSIASSDDVAEVAIVSPIVTTIASASPVISAPGTRSMAKAMRIALITIAARPRVTTLSGSVNRARVGKTSALRTPISSAAPSAAPTPSSVNRSRSWAKISRTIASTTTHDGRPLQHLKRVRKAVRCGPRIHVDGESSRIARRGGALRGLRNRERGRGDRPEARADPAGDHPGRRHGRRERDRALSDLPAADPARLALRGDVRGRLRGGAGSPARAADAARARRSRSSIWRWCSSRS